jgi:hypothetical protein
VSSLFFVDVRNFSSLGIIVLVALLCVISFVIGIKTDQANYPNRICVFDMHVSYEVDLNKVPGLAAGDFNNLVVHSIEGNVPCTWLVSGEVVGFPKKSGGD